MYSQSKGHLPDILAPAIIPVTPLKSTPNTEEKWVASPSDV